MSWEATPTDRPRRVYVDGIWDLFHPGHVAQLKYLKNLDGQHNHLVVGIVSDEDASGYKRPPVLAEKGRKTMIESCKFVDEVVENCPLTVTTEFMERYNIDVVAHGFMNDADFEKQKDFYEIPMRQHKFRRVDYNHGISTTEIMQKIKEHY